MNDDQSPTPPTGWQFNPGDTVAPATPQQTSPASPAVPREATVPSSTPVAQVGDSSVPEFAEQVEATPTSIDAEGQITWTASEYVAHHKTSTWYVTLVVIAVVTAGVAFLATRDFITAVSIILIALVFGLSASRKPRVLEYRLDNRGLKIAQKSYPYSIFRSFAVIDEGAFSSIVFVPLKRFMPMMTIYYAPEDENQIVQIIADHLPMEQRKHDAIDALLHKIRF
jgi:hypothetical protein